MKNLIPLFLLLFSLITVKAQTDFTINDFDYQNEFEKSILEKYFDNPNEKLAYLGVFLTSDASARSNDYDNAQKAIQQVIAEIKSSRAYQRDTKRKINFIYKTVHDKFFDRYREDASFLQIFSKKEYNCATASALYAVILKELNIPFEVHFSENHVFLVAYPQSAHLIIETTNPVVGTTSYSKSFMDSYVANLRKTKLISQNEYDSKPVEVIFREFFFKTEKGDIKTIAGILYYNQGLRLVDAKDYLSAIQMGIRTYYFMSGYEKAKLLVVAASGFYLQSDARKSPTYFNVLGRLANIKHELISISDISNYVNFYFRDFAIKGERERLEESYKSFTDIITDSTLFISTKTSFLKEMGRMYYLKQNFKKAFTYVDSSYFLNANDKEAEFMYLDLTEKMLDNSQSPDDILNILNSSIEKHKSLAKNTQLHMMRSSIMMFFVLNEFEKGKNIEGEKKLSQFTQEYSLDKKHLINSEIFERTIGEIAIFYYKKGQTRRSNERVDLGLTYFPNSSYLKRVKMSINN